MKNHAINIQNFAFITKNILYLYLTNHIENLNSNSLTINN